jgi:hypothetical protein
MIRDKGAVWAFCKTGERFNKPRLETFAKTEKNCGPISPGWKNAAPQNDKEV